MITSCAHCGATAARAVGDLDGRPVFCCHGCRTVWQALHEAGLEGYYRSRDALPEPGAPQHAVEGAADGASTLEGDGGACFVRVDGDGAWVTLAVDGIHCASCGWVIERLLLRSPGVLDVQVALGAGRARVRVADAAAPGLPTLVRQLGRAGYTARPLRGDDEGAQLADRGERRAELVRLGVAAACAMNLMLFAVALYGGDAFGMDPVLRRLFRGLSLLVATPLLLVSAAPILRRAVGALRAGLLHVDVPVALALLVLYGSSAVATVWDRGEVWFDSLGMFVMLLLAGRSLEAAVRGRSTRRLSVLAVAQSGTVQREGPDGERPVQAEALRPGDLVVLRAGDVARVDLLVIDGRCEVDRAVVDGESRPVLAGVGTELPSGTRILNGHLRARVLREVGDDTLSQARAAVAAALARRSPAEQWADRLARTFVLGVLIAAAASAVSWSIIDPARVVPVTVAVLVVACPCALALATPLAFAAAVHGAARRGLLLRSGDALLRLADVRFVAFDKTGTLTTAQPEPGPLRLTEAGALLGAERVLRLAGAAGASSHHPVARAVVAAMHERAPGPHLLAEEVVEEAGVGLRARVGGATVSLGRPGASIRRDGVLLGELELRHEARPDAKEAVRALRALGLRVVLLSGDNAERVTPLRAELHLDEAHAELLPSDKARWVAERQAAGAPVLCVGDGLNDGLALAEARVSLAMGGAVDLALQAADGALIHRRIEAVVDAVRLGRALKATLRSNVVISLAYNALAVGAAALGLVTPLLAAALMPLSSLVVVLRAARLAAPPRRVR